MKGVSYLLLLVSLAKILSANEATEVENCLNARSSPSKANCNQAITGSSFRCCYVEKTEREGKKADVKTCDRIYNDESSLDIYKRRYNDDYKDINIQCSSGYLMMSLFILIALFF